MAAATSATSTTPAITHRRRPRPNQAMPLPTAPLDVLPTQAPDENQRHAARPILIRHNPSYPRRGATVRREPAHEPAGLATFYGLRAGHAAARWGQITVQHAASLRV